jgi:hypothetical protein
MDVNNIPGSHVKASFLGEDAFGSFFLDENAYQSCCDDRIMAFHSIGILVIPFLQLCKKRQAEHATSNKLARRNPHQQQHNNNSLDLFSCHFVG